MLPGETFDRQLHRGRVSLDRGHATLSVQPVEERQTQQQGDCQRFIYF